MVDASLVGRRLSDLDTYLTQIREFANLSAEQYRSDWKTQRIVERTLQMLIETCADLASHAVSDAGWRPPTGYADTFRVLAENRVVDEGLAATLEQMARFRNVIVHQYTQVDADIVVHVLHNRLSDFARYREAMLLLLKKV